MLLKHISLWLLISCISCWTISVDSVEQGQQDPLPAQNFGREFPEARYLPTISGSNSIKKDVCLNPITGKQANKFSQKLRNSRYNIKTH